MSTKKRPESKFGFLINAILSEKNVGILSKFQKIKSKEEKEEKKQKKIRAEAAKQRKLKKEMLEATHVEPDQEYRIKEEEQMRKTATHGVVALFKAIAEHQRKFKRQLLAIDQEQDILKMKTMKMEQEMSLKFERKLVNNARNTSTDRGLMRLRRNGQLEWMEMKPSKRRRLNDSKDGIKEEDDDSNDDDDDDGIDSNVTAEIDRSRLPRHLQNVLVDSETDHTSANDDDDEDEGDGFNDDDLNDDDLNNEDLGQREITRKGTESEGKDGDDGKDGEESKVNKWDVLKEDVNDSDDDALDDEQFVDGLKGDNEWMDNYGSDQNEDEEDIDAHDFVDHI